MVCGVEEGCRGTRAGVKPLEWVWPQPKPGQMLEAPHKAVMHGEKEEKEPFRFSPPSRQNLVILYEGLSRLA